MQSSHTNTENDGFPVAIVIPVETWEKLIALAIEDKTKDQNRHEN